jgi:asparagine synthase (glutamine-hydrolysing)
MCGIFGIKYIDSARLANKQLVIDSTDLMSHRGPDDAGYWVQGSVGLGHRRLSIIDLSPLGHQPMFNEDGCVGLVYNGEIYNYQELYKPLCDKGHTFRSRSDTEVIIHAYEEWGFDCVNQFNGMFAFGIWDERKQSLWIVRDRLGIKPLYYYWNGDVFIFSSEIKPILKTGFVKPEMNEKVLDAYFSLGYVPGPETMFRNIKKVMPGHYLSLHAGKLTDTEYWDFAYVEDNILSYREYEEKLEVLLQDSIRKRLRSDVPLGVFLSGGLDSSTVVALMSDMISDPINTFTVGYDMSRNFSEEPFAEMVATKFNTKHHVFKLEPDDFFTSIEKLVEFAEEPIVEPAAIALYHISKLARQSATVLLSGEGSDEILAGYFLYDIMSKIDKIQKYVPSPLLRLVKSASVFSNQLKIKKYSDWLCLPLERRYQGTSSYLTDMMKKDLYSKEFYDSKGNYLEDTFSAYFAKVGSKPDSLAKMLYVDTKTWLVDDLLVKADKMTMAASIELRVPFLDYRMVELAASFPSDIKLASGNGKAILKSIMKNKLPESIVNRKKMGFPVPIDNWFGSELKKSLDLLENNVELTKWINPEFMQHNIFKNNNGMADNGKLIMSLLVLTFWRDKYLSC